MANPSEDSFKAAILSLSESTWKDGSLDRPCAENSSVVRVGRAQQPRRRLARIRRLARRNRAINGGRGARREHEKQFHCGALVSTTITTAALSVARRLRELRDRLAATDLRPSAHVNATFSELVDLCCRTPAPVDHEVLRQVVQHAPSLRAICSAGECELERHWATRIVAARDPHAALQTFPYLSNYKDLVRLELGALAAVGEPMPSRVVILGSGPLPLTGMVLAIEHGAHVVHIDRDAESLHLSSALMHTLGLDDQVDSVLADLEEPAGREIAAAACQDARVVVLAALVGADAPAKASISRWLGSTLSPGTPVLVRSAIGLRTLLYPQVGADDLPGLEVALEVHPRTDVVNSVLVARAGASVAELAG